MFARLDLCLKIILSEAFINATMTMFVDHSAAGREYIILIELIELRREVNLQGPSGGWMT